MIPGQLEPMSLLRFLLLLQLILYQLCQRDHWMSVQLLIVPGVKLGKHTCSSSSSEHAVTPVSSKEPTATDLPELHLPVSLHNVTKYHEDFVKYEDQATASRVMESMQDQWSELDKPGCKVKVKIKDELADTIISFDGCYF